MSMSQQTRILGQSRFAPGSIKAYIPSNNTERHRLRQHYVIVFNEVLASSAHGNNPLDSTFNCLVITKAPLASSRLHLYDVALQGRKHMCPHSLFTEAYNADGLKIMTQ